MTNEKEVIKTLSLEDLQERFDIYNKNELLSYCKGKNKKEYFRRFKDGDIVKITKVRPRNKKWLRNNWYNTDSYYKIAATNKVYGHILSSTNESRIERKDREKLEIMTKGYKTTDLYNLDSFICKVFPIMIDEFITRYTKTISDESPDYNKAIKVLQTLKKVLEENVAFLNSDDCYDKEKDLKLQRKTKKAFADFGEWFHAFWI